MQNSEATRGVAALMRKVRLSMRAMTAQTEAREGGHVPELLNNGIRKMGVPSKPEICLRKKSVPNRLIFSRLITFTVQMFHRAATMQTAADRETIAAMRVMDATSVRIISAVIPTLVQVQISTAETKIGVVNAALVLTEASARRSQTQ